MHISIIRNATMLILVGTLILSAYARNLVWSNEFSLWSDVAYKSPLRQRAYLNLCVWYEGAGEITNALTNCNKAVSLQQINFITMNALINRGAIYSDLGQYDPALKDYQAALVLGPDNWRTHNNIANLLAKQGRLSECLKHYTRAIQLNPNYTLAYVNRGTIYSQNLQYDAAIDDFTHAMILSPENSSAIRKRGLAYAALGKKDKAAVDLTKACALSNEAACTDLGHL